MIRFKSVQRDGMSVVLCREIDNPDGTHEVEVMSMPDTVFSIRAGEYGMDVEKDADDVLDIILHEHWVNSSGEFYHPLLVTEDTLESAREKHLNLCRKVRDLHANRFPKKHTDEHHKILEAFKNHLVVDQQLAHLHRDRMKHEVKREKNSIAMRVTEAERVRSIKSAMIDDIRRREDV